MSRIPVQEDVGVAITKSLFSRVDETGTLEESMVDYLCIYEQDQHGSKTRWLFLAVSKFGKCLLHKGKKNSNGTFSKGKTWNLDDMRQLEQTGPMSFSLTMTSRTYKYRTDNARDLTEFLNNLVKTFKSQTGAMPHLVNFNPNTKTASMASSTATQPNANSVYSRYSEVAADPPYPPVPAPPVQSERHRRDSQADQTPGPMLPPISPYTPLHITPNTSRPQGGGVSPRPGPSALPGRSPRTPATALPVPSAPPTAGAHLLPPRSAGPMASTTSLSSSHKSNNSIDLAAPVHGRRSSLSSEASASRSIASQDGFDNRRPKVTPRDPRDARDARDIGLGVPPPHRRGSGDNRPVRPPQSDTSSRDRRPSNTSEIPPVRSSYADDDPYGGMADTYSGREQEVLDIPPVPSPRSDLLIPPVVNEPEPEPEQERAAAQPSVKEERTPSLTDKSTESVSKSSAPRLEVNTLAPPEPRSRSRSPDLGAMQRRVSFHPPPLTTAYSRDVLLTSRSNRFGAIEDEDPEEAGDAIMANVEEMIEGFDWTAVTTSGGDRSKGTDAIEGRLLDELAALESANIHAFLESDDRVDQVIAHIDDALMELDDIDMQLAGYRMQLSVVSEDIEYIEGQNRGLQVQTSNQHALLNEIRQLLQITEVPRADLSKLSQISPSTPRGVEELEKAAASLYKAIQASREKANEVAATNQHMREYREASSQFCTRVLEYLDIAFKHQSASTLADFRKASKSREPKLAPHSTLCENLMPYEGLVLFVKDMDDDRYRKLCTNYITTISGLHQSEMGELLASLQKRLPSANHSMDIAFAKAQAAPPPKLSAIGGAVVRSKTVKRPSDGPGSSKRGDKASVKVAETYSEAMAEIVGQIVTEDDFITTFLHLADNESTFADYMQLDNYFRRQATRHASRNNPSLLQIARSVMDLMFGFVDGDLKNWVGEALKTDMSCVVGMIAVMEHLSEQAEQEGTSLFLTQLFDKQLSRHWRAFDHFINDQIKTIDGAKTNMKRKRGVFYFVRHFPLFVERLECQLMDADGLKIRRKVDDAYERVVASVLGSLQYLSKIVGAETSSGEDKGQLYFHVVMIENLHVFVDETSNLKVRALAVYTHRAQGLYKENIEAYIKMMMRRGFSRLMDFMDGVERLLKTTPPNEVSLHNNYSKSTLKKVLKDTSSKDMRKAVEAMARRVDKHFTHDDDAVGGAVGGGPMNNSGASDPATQALIAYVWLQLSNALKSEITRAIDTIAKCYDNSLTLDYTLRDIESACQRAKSTR